MKIIASDFDGTFSHNGVDAAKKDAVKRWRNAGNVIGLVSGRGRGDVLGIGKESGVDFDFFIANNGSVILDGKGNSIKEFRGDGDVIDPLVRFILEIGGRDFALYSGQVRVLGKKLSEYKNGSLYKNCLSLLPQDVQTVFSKTA